MDNRRGFESESGFTRTELATYSVWNANPQKPTAEPTPGIVMKTGKGDTEKREIVQNVRAVLLFRSGGMSKSSGNGKDFKTLCESHGTTLDPEGKLYRPAPKIQEPFCRDAEAKDVADIFSGWKGYDAAKVDAAVKEVVDDEGKLSCCGLKAGEGMIPLCKYAKWRTVGRDTIKPTCKPFLFVHGYDLEREREFTMKLTGSGIQADKKYTAPIHQFFQFLRAQGERGALCFEYEVTLSSLQANGSLYVLGVSGQQRLIESEVAKMEARALAARSRWEKLASWVPSEMRQDAKEVVPPPAKTVSFADDDIPFA